jgi:rod shape-determining protein MreD
MLRRALALTALLLTALILQVSLVPLVVRGGFMPDLVLVVVVMVSLESGARPGLRTAAVGGLLVDLTAATVPVGTSVVVYATVAYVVAVTRPYLSEQAALTTALLAGALGAAGTLLRGGLQVILTTQDPPPARLVGWSALVVGAFAVLLAPLVRAVVRRILGDRSLEPSDEVYG